MTKRTKARATECRVDMVTQGNCRRLATTSRTTVRGVKIPLCRQCDERWGAVIEGKASGEPHAGMALG